MRSINGDNLRTGRLIKPINPSFTHLTIDTLSGRVNPKRIKYHPGVELEVVINNDKGGSAGEADYPMPNSQQYLQEQVDQMQQMQKRQQEVNEELLRGQSEMIRLQLEAISNLSHVRGRIEALITQTYELHEYPIPRLFIVLPKPEDRFRDRITGLISEPYQLHFLCECGAHTMSKDSRTQHEIHLAKHEGYDLEKPTEFFQKYGPYILKLMHMIKFGIITAGVVVPPLSTLKILDGLSDAQQYVKYLKGNIASLVDSAIKNIEGISGISEMGTELIAHHERINSLEAVEGPSLRQLQSYLRIEDQDQALGNLYRIVTAEGHVKWVCQDHFRSSYGESTIQLLRDFIESQNGYFIEKTGRIEIKIGSKHIARQFYDGIAKARGIQELEITLAWDATMSDLRALASAVSKANVIQLTVDGSHFKRPWDDVFNSRRRFDPIMQLARIERIRYLQLKCFDTFFPRVSQKSLMPSSKLRVFSMESGDQLSHKVIKFFHQLIKNHRQTTLKLGLTRLPVAESNRGIISKVFGFQSLKINLELSLSTRDSHSAAQDVELTIERLLDFRTRDFKFIQGIHPTRLVITYTPQEADEGRLATILRHSPKLAHLKVGCKGHRVPAIFDLVIETREGILKEDRSSGLRTFELLEEGLIPFDSCIACDDSTYIQTHVLFTDNSTKFDMETRIRLQGSIRDESNTLDEFVRRYKWSIVDR